MSPLRQNERLRTDPETAVSSQTQNNNMSSLLDAEHAPETVYNDDSNSNFSSDFDSDLDPDSDSDAYSETEPDETIASTIIREIQDGTYTCLVCTSEIDQDLKIWSCRECFRVYDLDCIQDWAKNGSSTDKVQKTWRCPACNVVTASLPQKFTCWCGKVTNPRSNSLMPFSCGNPCNKKYPGCVHSCSSACHPGHHPVCGALGPLMKCHCGKHERQLPCLITPYEQGWKCEVPCDIVVCDLGHSCPVSACHSGFCGPCDRQIEQTCYCGQLTLNISCYQRFPKQCYDRADSKSWIGSFQCGKKSKIYYDCGVHYDEVDCQQLPTDPKKCTLSPDMVKTCHCGKTPVDPKSRKDCSDPIPECESVCGKKLSCGCTCIQKCHSGECVCFNILESTCSCENYTFLVPCKFLQDGYEPKCTRKCPVLLNCRKHYHREVCCPYEKEALRREREKKKAIRNGTRTVRNEDETMTMEPIHICTRTCNRLKSCGHHYCEAMCHAGSCGVCLESSPEDLVCHCGKTRIEAPVRCGTVIECHEQCVRPKSCGHAPEVHECHLDDENCPKCTVSVTKKCNCGRKDIKNVLCWQTNVSCGTMCTETKACGHPCLDVCSPDCTQRNIHASTAKCQLFCKKTRTKCPHTCKSKCHFKKPGKPIYCDAFLCKEPVHVQCACGKIKKQLSCNANSLNTSTILLNIECDDDCLKAARDEELRKALLDEDQQSLQLPYSDSVMDVYERQTLWCSKMEANMRSFVSKNTKNNTDKEADDALSNEETNNDDELVQEAEAVISSRFSGLNAAQVAFLCDLASSFLLYSESTEDSMFIALIPRTKVPSSTLGEAVLQRKAARLEKEKQEQLKNKDLEESLYNAILVQDVFFGIVREELDQEILPVLSSYKIEAPAMHWMKEATYVFYSGTHFKLMTLDEENKLYLAMKSVRNVIRNKSLAFNAKLCLVDAEVEHILKVNEKGDLGTKTTDTTKVETEANLDNNAFSLLGKAT